jgi:hypothetical protein
VAGDLRTFDAGNFFLCTVEEVGADAIGKLWVEYDVELFVPQLVPAAPVATRASVYLLGGGAQALATGVPEPIEFDTVMVDGLGLGAPVAGVLTPPAGTYLCMCTMTATDTGAEEFTVNLQLYKNGAAANNHLTQQKDTVSAGGIHSVTDLAYVVCNGTDTINWEATAFGAAGNLSLIDDRTICSFQIV